jgi:hypothetical protein
MPLVPKWEGRHGDARHYLNTDSRRVLVDRVANIDGTLPIDVLDEAVCRCPARHYANSKLPMHPLARTRFERLRSSCPFNYISLEQAD